MVLILILIKIWSLRRGQTLNSRKAFTIDNYFEIRKISNGPNNYRCQLVQQGDLKWNRTKSWYFKLTSKWWRSHLSVKIFIVIYNINESLNFD
jgi:hypothetical protein